MKILVINVGSSSLKYQLIETDNESVLSKGNCERIGSDDSFIGFKSKSDDKIIRQVPMHNHIEAFEAVKDALTDEQEGAIHDLSEISAVGHRVVQGGSYFEKSELVNEEVIKKIEELAPLAPLHNPAALQGIDACTKVFGDKIPQVVVFDTSFHQTMPEKAYMYAVPYEYYEKHNVRKYGFHGSSHRYVSEKMIQLMGNKKDLRLITCHIGSGSSIAAIKDGAVIDTTMGMTPLAGFMMGTRSGSIDPSIVSYIAEKEDISADEVISILNKKSGLLGISGISADDRDILKAEQSGDKKATLAHDMLYYQIAQYIGSSFIALGGCDGIVFTAGLGENQSTLREGVCKYLGCIGVKLDEEANNKTVLGVTGTISAPDSKVRVEVIATDEEMIIARDTKSIVEAL